MNKRDKKNFKMVTARLPPELVEKLDQLAYDNHTDRSTEITKAIISYIQNKFEGVSEPASKYTAEEFKKAETDDALVECFKLQVAVLSVIKLSMRSLSC